MIEEPKRTELDLVPVPSEIESEVRSIIDGLIRGRGYDPKSFESLDFVTPHITDVHLTDGTTFRVDASGDGRASMPNAAPTPREPTRV